MYVRLLRRPRLRLPQRRFRASSGSDRPDGRRSPGGPAGPAGPAGPPGPRAEPRRADAAVSERWEDHREAPGGSFACSAAGSTARRPGAHHPSCVGTGAHRVRRRGPAVPLQREDHQRTSAVQSQHPGRPGGAGHRDHDDQLPRRRGHAAADRAAACCIASGRPRARAPAPAERAPEGLGHDGAARTRRRAGPDRVGQQRRDDDVAAHRSDHRRPMGAEREALRRRRARDRRARRHRPLLHLVHGLPPRRVRGEMRSFEVLPAR